MTKGTVSFPKKDILLGLRPKHSVEEKKQGMAKKEIVFIIQVSLDQNTSSLYEDDHS